MTHPIVEKIIDFVSQLDYENGPAWLDEIVPQGNLPETIAAITEHLDREAEISGEGSGIVTYEWRVEENDYAVTLDVFTSEFARSMMSLDVFVV